MGIWFFFGSILIKAYFWFFIKRNIKLEIFILKNEILPYISKMKEDKFVKGIVIPETQD